MLRIISPKLFLIPAMVLFASAGLYAQGQRPVGPPKDARFGDPALPTDRPHEPRPNLFQELGLSREQIQAVRRLNQDRKPIEQAARERFQEANRALNMAIYADTVDEGDFRAKLAEVQAADAELAKIKFTNELAVRRVLTPAQLIRFRELRRRFAEQRQKMQNERLPPGDGPIREMRRGGGPPIN